jgi:hypothetical protein
LIKKSLLSVFFIAAYLFPLFSLVVPSFKPVDSIIFINENCTFSTLIPGVPPSQVQITVQSLPESVSFVSSRKQEVINGGMRSTELFVVLKFTKTGNYTIPPIAARIQYGFQHISFTRAAVYDNPRNTQPRIYLEFEDVHGNQVPAITEGKPVRAVLYGMYFASVLSVKSSAPENGLLIEKQSLFSMPYTQSTFTASPIALIIYEFTPFTQGTFVINSITAELTTWAGAAAVLGIEPKTVIVSPGDPADAAGNASNPFDEYTGISLFPNAFDSAAEGVPESAPSTADAEALLKSGIEKRKFLVYSALICALFCIIFIAVWFILRKVNKKRNGFIFPAALLFLAGVCIGLLLLPRYGVYSGGPVLTIPEHESKTAFIIEDPSIVRIHLETGLWTYIKLPEIHQQSVKKGGWVRSDAVKHITLQERSN